MFFKSFLMILIISKLFLMFFLMSFSGKGQGHRKRGWYIFETILIHFWNNFQWPWGGLRDLFFNIFDNKYPSAAFGGAPGALRVPGGGIYYQKYWKNDPWAHPRAIGNCFNNASAPFSMTLPLSRLYIRTSSKKLYLEF